LRRLPARRPAKPGRKKAVAVNALLAKPPNCAPEAVETTAVLIVSVFVSAPPDGVNETEATANVQEKYAGSFPQEKFRGPVRPPCGVIVKITVPEPANGIARLAGFTVAVNPGVTTVSVKGGDVLPVKFASPP
jgi:hypothetical protein